MVSLPIPDSCANARYADIKPRGIDLGEFVPDKSKTAHLDPDLDRTSLRRSPEWRPAFGQSRAAAKHLENQKVGPGDLFLFFGWFRRFERTNGRWRPTPHAPDLHVLFGWLWVDEVFDLPCEPPPGLESHPHFASDFHDDRRPWSRVFRGTPDGGGIFPKFSDELRLSAEGSDRSNWVLPSCFHGCRLSYHIGEERWSKRNGCCHLRTVGRGQEFVLDCKSRAAIRRWAESLIGKYGSA